RDDQTARQRRDVGRFSLSRPGPPPARQGRGSTPMVGESGAGVEGKPARVLERAGNHPAPPPRGRGTDPRAGQQSRRTAEVAQTVIFKRETPGDSSPGVSRCIRIVTLYVMPTINPRRVRGGRRAPP